MRRALLLFALMTAGGCAGASVVGPQVETADLILVVDRVHTLDPEQPNARGVAIANGRIVATGDEDALEIWRGPETRWLELDRATIVPGLVDAHLHLESVGRAASRLELRELALDALLEAVEVAAESVPPGTAILGRGWDQNLWGSEDCPVAVPRCLEPEGFPDRRLLDAVAPEHPVVLTRVDGHALWANSRALALGAVTSATPDPEGGRAVRRADGEPAGVLIDNAMALVESRLPPPTEEDVERSIEAAQDHLLALGLTAVHDMGTSPVVLEVLRRMDRNSRLRLRVFAYHWGNDGDLDAIIAAGPERGRRLEVVGVKLMIDGALGSRGAALLEPYADADHDGALLLSEDELEQRVRITRRVGLYPAVHAIGDRGNRTVLDVFERVYGDELAKIRPRVEHAQILHLADLERLARGGVVPSMQPTHATSDMPWAEERIGSDRLAGAYAWRTLRVAGATVAAGSDAPVELADPLRGLFAARTRQDVKGRPPGGWRPEERMTSMAALRSFTWGPAWAVHAEQRLGSLTPGRIADLTVLSVDPVADPAEALLEAEVLMTVVGGRIEHDGRDGSTESQTLPEAEREGR